MDVAPTSTRHSRMSMGKTARLSRARMRGRLAGFARHEDGSAVVLSMFVILGMMMAMGFAVDRMRAEQSRVKIQNAIDRAVLAAASLEQTLAAEDVVRDYLSKAAIGGSLGPVTVTQGIGSRSVSASVTAEVPTLFPDLIGTPGLTVAGAGTAMEAITDIEIALVLDISNSMNSGGRLDALKDAAIAFVDTVLERPQSEQRISISIVPYTGQVNAQPILTHFNVQGGHAFGSCVNFPASGFSTLGHGPDAPLQRADLFDPWYVSTDHVVTYCPTDSGSRILVHSNDRDLLAERINGLVANGNTSIDIGMRWANVILDPDFRPVVDGLVALGAVSGEFAGRPFDYGSPESAKFIIVMSDGQNTEEYLLRESFRSGPSPVWRNPSNGRLSVHRDRPGTPRDWYRPASASWESGPDGGAAAVRLTWPDVFEDVTVAYAADHLIGPAYGGRWYWSMLTYLDPSEKNVRTASACTAAKAAGTTIYAIGFEAPAAGLSTLSACASSASHFFDVNGVEISTAFRSIARQINQLRLTQ